MTPRGRARAGVAGTVAALTALGLAGLAAAGAGSGGGDPGPGRVVTVHLTAVHSRFSPASVTVPPGAVVRFVVRNLDPIDHEFIVGGPATHAHHEAGRDAVHHGEVPGEVSVAAGRTASTTWTAPAEAATVVFACHLPGHLAYGMDGVVTVAP